MKKRINENKLLAIIYSNFSGKGKQTNDWIFLAKKLKELKDLYKSEKKVAKNTGISYEMVRSTIKLLDLPREIQKLVKDDKLSQDLGWRLLGIKNKKKQIIVAKAIEGLDAHDGRDMIRYAKNNPEKKIKEQINRLKQSKKQTENVNLIIITLNDDNYKTLNEISKKNKTNPQKMITKIINSWIKNRR